MMMMMIMTMILMMIMIIIIVIIIIKLTLQAQFKFVCNMLTVLQTVCNTYSPAARAQSCATRWALMTCNMLHAIWYKGELSF